MLDFVFWIGRIATSFTFLQRSPKTLFGNRVKISHASLGRV